MKEEEVDMISFILTKEIFRNVLLGISCLLASNGANQLIRRINSAWRVDSTALG